MQLPLCSRPLTVLISSVLAALAGCGSYPSSSGFPSVENRITGLTGKRVQWNQGLAEDQEVQATIDKLLSEPVSRDVAVQIAILNNRRLQATYEQLGVAQAELVQAGLLSLPVFSVAVSFPSGGGVSDLDLGVAQSFVDLLTLRARVRIAEDQFEAVKAGVSSEIIRLAGEAEVAYFRVQASDQFLEMLQQVRETTQASLEVAQKLYEAGNITELDLANEKALAGEAKAQFVTAKADAQVSRERLAQIMGLTGPQVGSLQVPVRLLEVPPSEKNWSEVEAEAVEANLILIASQHRIQLKTAQMGVTNVESLFRGVELGAVSSREDQAWDGGPEVEFGVPVPPKGRKAIQAKGMAELRREVREREAAIVEIQSAARVARGRLLAARETIELYREELLPVSESITQQTLLEYNAMQMGVFQLLEARRRQIDTGRRYISALYEYWAARAELETLLKGSMLDATPGISPEAAPSNLQSSETH